jgi:glucose/arabinose dehydrogenase
VSERSARARRALPLSLALTLSALLAGCGGGYTPAGPFRPLPQGTPPEVGPPSASAPAPDPGNPANPESGQRTGDPNVVASKLDVPTGLAVLPDGTAIVGERDTGRLLQVFPDRAPARPLMTLHGLDTTGDGGLLGLALSPSFTEDGLIYAYVSTAKDNRVIRFPLGGTPNPVLTGIPHGPGRNGGGLLFAPDGTLFVGTGDTGKPALARNPTSKAGKVLHIDVFGHPADSGGPVYARGFGDVTALCESADEKLYATDDVPGGPAELDPVNRAGDYGWPAASPGSLGPVTTFPAAEGGLGGCAFDGRTAFLGSMNGKRIDVVPVQADGSVGKVTDILGGRYGRLRTVVLDDEGALWITTSNRDGFGLPTADDDRVLRIVPPTSAGNSPL